MSNVLQRYIIIGDTQLHPWMENIDDRHWRKLPEIFDHAAVWADELDADGIVHMGDLFESKRAVRSDVLVATIRKIKEVTQTRSPMSFFFLAGNHDFYGGECMLDVLPDRDNVVVVTREPYKIQGALFVPYGIQPDPDIRYRVMFAHADIRSAHLGHGIHADTSTIDERCLLKQGKRELVVNGHYHHPQQIQLSSKHVPVECMGTPYHVSWSDMDSPRRGLTCIELLEGGGYRIKRKTLGSYPCFLSSAEHTRPGLDFVRETAKLNTANASVREESYTVGGADMRQSIQGYAQSRTNSKKKARTLAEIGFALYSGQLD